MGGKGANILVPIEDIYPLGGENTEERAEGFFLVTGKQAS